MNIPTWQRFVPLAVALALTLAACGNQATPSASADGTDGASALPSGSQGPGGPRTGGDLIFARPEDNTTMDPIAAVETETIYVLKHIMETLFVTSEDGKSVEPWLATGHELSDDKLTWTIPLREGVMFHDGQEMVADDVVFSIDRGRSEDSGFGFLLAAIDTVEAVDDHTVEITTLYPWDPLLADLALWSASIVPSDLRGMSAEAFFEDPIGTGPFTLDAWKRGTELRVVRFDDYWQEGKPYLDSVTWRQVPDTNTRVLQLQGGQADIVSDVPFNTVESLDSADGTAAQGFASTTNFYLMFNTTIEPFDDVHVRRAIAHAIDKEAMAEAVLFGQGRPACSIIQETVAFYDPETPCLDFDLEAAQEELAQSPVPDGFDTTYLVPDEPTAVAIAEIIQQQLQPLDINMEIERIDPGQFYETLSNFDYELAYAGFSMDIPDPDEVVSFMLDYENGGGDSYSTGYNNPEMNELVRAAQQELDDDARQEIYTQIQQLHADEIPHFPLVFVTTPFGWRESVQDLFINPVGDRHLENVWLSE